MKSRIVLGFALLSILSSVVLFTRMRTLENTVERQEQHMVEMAKLQILSMMILKKLAADVPDLQKRFVSTYKEILRAGTDKGMQFKEMKF